MEKWQIEANRLLADIDAAEERGYDAGQFNCDCRDSYSDGFEDGKADCNNA